MFVIFFVITGISLIFIFHHICFYYVFMTCTWSYLKKKKSTLSITRATGRELCYQLFLTFSLSAYEQNASKVTISLNTGDRVWNEL